jgi:hypothetical protein
MNETEKKCTKCLTSKPLDCFYRGNGRLGRSSRCKDCIIEDVKNLAEKNRVRSNIPYVDQKRCSKCGSQKPRDEFGVDSATVDGLRVWCKVCCSNTQKSFYSDYKKQKGKAVPTSKKCCRCKSIKQEALFGKSRSSRDGLTYICKQCAVEISKINRPKTTKHRRERYRNDPVYRICQNLRRRMKLALDGESKSAPSMRLLGVSGAEVVVKLSELFWPGMTKENSGPMKWVVDHVIPVSAFDKSNPDWQFRCFHWTNLQPLWKDDNGCKAARLDWTPSESKHELPDRLKVSG